MIYLSKRLNLTKINFIISIFEFFRLTGWSKFWNFRLFVDSLIVSFPGVILSSFKIIWDLNLFLKLVNFWKILDFTGRLGYSDGAKNLKIGHQQLKGVANRNRLQHLFCSIGRELFMKPWRHCYFRKVISQKLTPCSVFELILWNGIWLVSIIPRGHNW